ncbi:DUF4363 family protein [Clostridium oryzae]|uniref:DUF4363 domain-containing protein n=1 Tax=Clostridium oryzae TaxID=1450648 RepID=A0A1V4IIS9_9CLOT|nr:DUF4363 family protein [Clostridium oryzae]OPJ59853.1 hypothetical protein CLORY_30700 [Clostridium oryzae]
MRNLLTKAIPILTLLLFILIMNSDNVLKKPISKDDDIPKSIQLIIYDVNAERWNAASKKTYALSKAWKKVLARVQFSAEKDEIDYFDVSLSRIKGAITAKSKSDAIIELNEAYEHWDNIGR